MMDNPDFWLFFDLAPVAFPHYYRDVHNVLALPHNATIRYEYRTKYLSDRAVHYSHHSDVAPKLALVVFAQSLDPPKVDPPPLGDAVHATFSSTMWVATRLCEVVYISPPEGEAFSYYLKVQHYPKNSEKELMQILGPLASVEELPFKKLVAISDQRDALSCLQSGSDGENWQQIVSRLALPPSKFAGNVFWRLEPACDIASTSLLRFGKSQLPSDDAARYRVAEGSKKTLFISAYEPSGVAEHRTRLGIPETIVNISDNNDEVISVEGTSSTIRLEQYGKKPLIIKAGYRIEIAAYLATLALQTQAGGDFPCGPDFIIHIEVFKPLWKKIAIVLILLGAVISSSLAFYWTENHGFYAVIAAAVAVVLILVGWALLTGKYNFVLPLSVLLLSLLV